MLLEDNNSVLYFDESLLFYINIETGGMNHYNIYDLKDYEDYNFCILGNNKFIIYSEKEMMVYKFENKKINKIFSLEMDIEKIFKLFKEEYILIRNKNDIKVFQEWNLKYKEIYHFDIKCFTINSINYIGKKKETYFFAKDDNKHIIIKISLNSKNEIVFNKEYLSISKVKECKFIISNKLFIELNNKNYVVYDLNYKQVEMVFGYKEKNCLKNIFKGMKNISKCIIKDFLYETNEQYYYQYNNFNVLKRNNDEIYFICKKRFYKTFKVFKYTYKEDKNKSILLL